jgi:hypothetical protein
MFCRIEVLKLHGGSSDVVFIAYETTSSLIEMEEFAARTCRKHGARGFRLRDMNTDAVSETWDERTRA